MDDQIFATHQGLLRCLLMLAEEAASLQLTRTAVALQGAASLCRVEAEDVAPGPVGVPEAALIH